MRTKPQRVSVAIRDVELGERGVMSSEVGQLQRDGEMGAVKMKCRTVKYGCAALQTKDGPS